MNGPESRWWSEPCAGGCMRTIVVWAREPGTVAVHAECPLPQSPENVRGQVHIVKDSDHCSAEDGQP